MWPDRVSKPGPSTYAPGALPIALRGPTLLSIKLFPYSNNLSYGTDSLLGIKIYKLLKQFPPSINALQK